MIRDKSKAKFGVAAFVVLLAALFLALGGSASALTIYVPTDYPTIQQAIDAANPGDTVFVYNGTYYEDNSVCISKNRITLQGEDKNSTTIHGKWSAEKVVYVTGNYVAVSNFTVAGSISDGYGIYVNGGKCIISDNTVIDGEYGIYLSNSENSIVYRNNVSGRCADGIHLEYSNGCVVSDNIANSNGGWGIYLSYSGNCKIENNIANSNYHKGIHVMDSSNCTLGNNIANSNCIGIIVSDSSNSVLKNNIANSNAEGGISLGDSNNCVLENNIANSTGYHRHGISLRSSSNCRIINNIASLNAGNGLMVGGDDNSIVNNIANSNGYSGILLVGDNNRIVNNIANSNWCGIELAESSNCVVENNTANSNDDYGIILEYSTSNCDVTNNIANLNRYGIRLESTSTNNNIIENTLTNNTEYGIYLDYSFDNYIYHNNFINNSKQAYNHHGFNDWDKGPIIGGNYWSDHVCHGNPSDGTEPYTGIDTDAIAVDNYPFEDPDGWVTPTPTVSITTDKTEYTLGDTMTITIDIANPTEDSVTFQWYWGVQQFNIWASVMSVPIPAGYDDTHDFRFTIPNWGSTPFGNVFYVQLTDTSGEVLDADCARWAYSPGIEAMPTVEIDIVREIRKTFERVELPG